MGPSFVANGTACCDVGIADGGHYDDVPLSDLSTFVEGSQRSMCAAKPTLLFVDEVFYRLEGAKKPVLAGTEYTNITQAVTSLLARPTAKLYKRCSAADSSAALSARRIRTMLPRRGRVPSRAERKGKQ